MRSFRILSLDGGGIKGAFSASVLATLEAETGRRCVDHFDLIAGTSTGGILAIGLGLGLSTAKLLAFYRDFGADIFPTAGLIGGVGLSLRQLFAPRRSHRILVERLEQEFGDRLLGDSLTRLAIPSYDAVAGRIYVFKTAHDERFRSDASLKASEVAAATAAAPTYYRAKAFEDGATYVDGGLWANNPVMVALTEAVSFLNAPLEGVDILSVGTTGAPFSISKGQRNGGALLWSKGVLTALMSSTAEAALAQARLLTNGGLHRIDALVSAGRFSLDQAEDVSDLIALGKGEARKALNLNAVRARFLNGTKAAPFVPAPAGKAD